MKRVSEELLSSAWGNGVTEDVASIVEEIRKRHCAISPHALTFPQLLEPILEALESAARLVRPPWANVPIDIMKRIFKHLPAKFVYCTISRLSRDLWKWSRAMTLRVTFFLDLGKFKTRAKTICWKDADEVSVSVGELGGHEILQTHNLTCDIMWGERYIHNRWGVDRAHSTHIWPTWLPRKAGKKQARLDSVRVSVVKIK
jgi:hypothetical protein